MNGPLTKLRKVLPKVSDTDLTLEGQARTVLHLLLDHVGGPAPLGSPHADPDRCPNCGGAATSLTGPYCSETCRDRAAFVRQFRAALSSGLILEPEKQVVFGERLWFLLGGGLPLRESRISESAKRQVARKSEGKCETCGASMVHVENFGSGCNRHVRAACERCYRTKPFGNSEFSRRPEVVELLLDLAHRVAAPTALRPCDDPDTWDWRAFLAERRAARENGGG